MRSGNFCSFSPGLCSLESHPWANMSSGDSAASGTADVDALVLPPAVAAFASFLAWSAAAWALSFASSRLPKSSA